ncbi:L,D-transpeptidase family protein [Methylococcus geothermalis]|uniref:L,D-transpeptidase family protein n=1 Tax=Methylococcus geothermalis TaxID=2681310 RepID=A0A858QA42_9GAMM|nr:L,D-transpeptidase family protein [Methylococcus geothermalis]QJD30802.1 L,D-transpeptidase family protein [Methylococcus geothermalis]
MGGFPRGRLIAFVAAFSVGADAAGAAPEAPAAHIDALVASGVHPRLRWGRFADVQEPLRALYLAQGSRPLWLDGGRPVKQSAAVLECLRMADDQGLNGSDYDADLLGGWIEKFNDGGAASAEEAAQFEVAMSLALMRYGSNLAVGRVSPRAADFALDVAPKRLDLPALVQRLAHDSRPCEVLAELEPKLPLYRNLKAALPRYRDWAGGYDASALVLPSKLSPGDRHKEVPALRKRLAAMGFLPQESPAKDPEAYAGDLVDAVERFQERHGLVPDGVIGKDTLAALNVPPGARLTQIRLGLERLRWLPEQFDGPFILVNIPSFRLYGYGEDHERPEVSMNVVVGRSSGGHNTPVFHSDMTYVVFRPYWNLPRAITVKEMLPGILRDPSYLARHNLEMVPSFGNGSQVYEPSPESLAMLSAGSLKLRQRPGPKNALGLVKFAFPNNDNIYLHGTPSVNLFQRARRDFSHGCIRVQDPVGLAEFVLKRQDEPWPPERIEAAMNGAQSRTVTLKQPLPVYIYYSTVLAEPDGTVRFFEDIYGLDLVLERLLEKGFPYPS